MFGISVFMLLVGSTWGAIYQDPVESPYEDGVLSVATRLIQPNLNPINPVPMRSKATDPQDSCGYRYTHPSSSVYYPEDSNNTYGVLYFVPGLFGVVPPRLYDDLITSVAAHGYVAISVWPPANGDGPLDFNFTAEAHVENINYLRDNLPREIRAIADFDYMGLGCHSAGCAPTLGLARLDTEPYLASVNLEPVSVTIVGGADFQGIPSLFLGAELANGSCSIPNFDFERFYDEFSCPKTLMEAVNAGHCDLLTDGGRTSCVGLVCAGSDETDLALYRRFVQGITAGFLNAHVQGNADMLEFVTDPSNIIYPLKQHRQDLDC